jgi:hypothetical protein
LGYFTSKRRIIGESPSGATEEVAIKMAPVARVGIMAGNAWGSATSTQPLYSMRFFKTMYSRVQTREIKRLENFRILLY